MSNLDFSVVLEVWPYLLSGLVFSLSLTGVTFIGGMALGTALALLEHLKVPVAAQAARLYVIVVRSIPLILVLFWLFFLVPLLLGMVSGSGRPVPIGATYTAFITFALFEAAYYAEILRVGLRSVNKGQYEAARALALTTMQTYRLVIMPQVIKIAAPVILSQTIVLFQDTSLVYVLSLTDLLGAASKFAQLNGRFVEMYVTVAFVYFVISSAASQAVTRLRRSV